MHFLRQFSFVYTLAPSRHQSHLLNNQFVWYAVHFLHRKGYLRVSARILYKFEVKINWLVGNFKCSNWLTENQTDWIFGFRFSVVLENSF